MLPASTISAADTSPAGTAAGTPPAPVALPEALAVAAALLLSAALQLANLGQQGLGNPYYAATVRSMLLSPRNAFFASYDPAGWVSVDKPPVGFWLQALSAKLLGFGGMALLLPQALATVASVALVWWLARAAFGPGAGVLAALVMALTPISVAAGRTNGLDPLLVPVLLGAAWALVRAVGRDSAAWLAASAALIGLGFEVKMLQAWLVLPAWAAAWWLGSRRGAASRARSLVVAGVALLAVSFAWPAAVQLTPPESRPWVGSSQDDSAFSLAVGYNGLQRLLPPGMTGTEDSGAPSPGAILSAFGAAETGERGPLRLFNGYLAAQIAWLLPLAALGWVAAWREGRGGLAPPLSPGRTALVFWGGWLLTCAAFFSVANQFHRYYLTMLGPPIAVLCGAGLAAMWRAWRRGGREAHLLPGAIAASAALAAWIAAPFPEAGPWVRPAILVAGAVAALLLAVTSVRRGSGPERQAAGWLAAALGLTALLLGPAVWSGWSVTHRVSNTLPAAGPGGDLFGFAPPSASDGPGGGPPGVAGIDAYQPPDPALVAFLEREHAGERFWLATGNAISASPLIIDRAMPVAALGGFIGQDPIVDVPGLRDMVERGEVRFFLVPDPRRVNLLATMLATWSAASGGDEGGGASPLPDRAQVARLFLSPKVRWVSETCRPVPPAEWQTPERAAGNPLAGLEALYDCAPATR